MREKVAEIGHVITDHDCPSNLVLGLIDKAKKTGSAESIDLGCVYSSEKEQNHYWANAENTTEIAPNMFVNHKKKPKNCYRHYTDPLLLNRKLRLLTNAYLMISYEHPITGNQKRWVSYENIQKYMARVTKMIDMSSKFNHKAFYSGALREEELRASWYCNMKKSGFDLDSSILASVNSKDWMTERDLEAAATDYKSIKSASGEFETPRPSGKGKTDHFGYFEKWPVPAWKNNGKRDEGSYHDRRWRNMRHTICLNHKNGVCQYSAKECNRAHGPAYLSPTPAYNENFKGEIKGDGKGKNKGSKSSRSEPYPAAPKGGKNQPKGKGKSE